MMNQIWRDIQRDLELRIKDRHQEIRRIIANIDNATQEELKLVLDFINDSENRELSELKKR